MKRGLSVPTVSFIMTIGIIVISLFTLFAALRYGSEGAHVQRSIEQGSIIYSIAHSVNALSSVQEGEVFRDLNGFYDIEIECNDECKIGVAPYDESGELLKESKKIIMLGNIQPV
jgi:hypothetical protein